MVRRWRRRKKSLMAPDENALRADVTNPAFRAGVADKRWRLVDIGWPHVFMRHGQGRPRICVAF
jgi:hypothetical protein